MKSIATSIATSIACAAMMFCFLGSPSSAHADECDDEQAGADDKKKNYKTIIGPDGKKTIVILKAFVVCGKVPKPTVLYAIQASTINYEWENLKKDFIPLILKTVKEAPF